MKILGTFLAVLFVSLTVHAGEADPAAEGKTDTAVQRILKSSGAVEVASKTPYGAGIQSIHLGYDADKKPVIGVAVRRTQTYKQADTLIAVIPEGDGYTVTVAEIPELASFRGKSKELAAEALKDVTGKVVKDEKGAKALVDVVTGATKYRKQIYVSTAVMASKVISELKANPAWPRTRLAK